MLLIDAKNNVFSFPLSLLYSNISNYFIPLEFLLSLLFFFFLIISKTFLFFSSLSFSVLLLLPLSSSQYREFVFRLRLQLLSAPFSWRWQQRPGTQLHQKRLRAFHLLTERLQAFPFFLLDWASPSAFSKPRPFSSTSKCQLSSSHSTDQSQPSDQGSSTSTTTTQQPQPTGLRGHPVTKQGNGSTSKQKTIYISIHFAHTKNPTASFLFLADM